MNNKNIKNIYVAKIKKKRIKLRYHQHAYERKRKKQQTQNDIWYPFFKVYVYLTFDTLLL